MNVHFCVHVHAMCMRWCIYIVNSGGGQGNRGGIHSAERWSMVGSGWDG